MTYYNFASVGSVDFLDKRSALNNWMNKLYNITNQIFVYENLPDTIEAETLEVMLQRFGMLAFYEHKGKVYVFQGSAGGAPDVYYRPTQFFIANPALEMSAQPIIGEECIVIKNDTNANGLNYTLTRTAQLLVETEISFYNSIIATRDYNAMVAKDDDTRESAEEYQRQLVEGHQMIITSDGFSSDDITRLPTASSANDSLHNLQEMYQYLKSQLFSDIGLKSSHNMKRQYVSEEENIVNDDTLIPQVDNMLTCRRTAIEQVNAMFDLNITVDLHSTWKTQELEVQNAQQIAEEGPLDEEQTGTEEITGDETEPIEESTETEDTVETEETDEPEIVVNIEADNIETVEVSTKEETEDDESTVSDDPEEDDPERER